MQWGVGSPKIRPTQITPTQPATRKADRYSHYMQWSNHAMTCKAALGNKNTSRHKRKHVLIVCALLVPDVSFFLLYANKGMFILNTLFFTIATCKHHSVITENNETVKEY